MISLHTVKRVVCLKGGLMMPQRQQMPFNLGNQRNQMGPNQRPMYHPMMNRQNPPSGPMGRMGQMGSMRHMRQMRQMGANGYSQRGSGGGLLAKILGKSNPAMGGGFPGLFSSASGGSSAASGGSFLKTLANPTAISGFLNNTQQVLSAFQQITPLVSQYGPIIKNIPTMWKLYRGLKDATTETDSEQNDLESADVEEKAEFDSEMEESITTNKRNSYKDEEQMNRKSHPRNSKKHSIAVNEINADDEDEDDWDEPEEKPRVHPFSERRSFPRMYI